MPTSYINQRQATTTKLLKRFWTCKNGSMSAKQKAKRPFASEHFIPVKQAAKRLRWHYTTLYRRIYKGEIVPVYIDGVAFIIVDDLKILKPKYYTNNKQEGKENGRIHNQTAI